MSEPKVTMYVREGCSDVAVARAYLQRRDVPWTEIDIERDPEARAKVVAWTGRAATPTIRIGDEILVEPDATEIDQALMQAAR